jgi:hypothetical protein
MLGPRCARRACPPGLSNQTRNIAFPARQTLARRRRYAEINQSKRHATVLNKASSPCSMTRQVNLPVAKAPVSILIRLS